MSICVRSAMLITTTKIIGVRKRRSLVFRGYKLQSLVSVRVAAGHQGLCTSQCVALASWAVKHRCMLVHDSKCKVQTPPPHNVNTPYVIADTYKANNLKSHLEGHLIFNSYKVPSKSCTILKCLVILELKLIRIQEAIAIDHMLFLKYKQPISYLLYGSYIIHNERNGYANPRH